MYLKRIWRSAFEALKKNKSRSALTMLGIVIGIASVITMLAVGKGTGQDVQEQVASLGVNMIVVTPDAATRQGVRSDAGSAKIFRRRHVDRLAAECPSVAAVSPVVMAPAQAKCGSENWRTSVMGVYSSYFSIRNLEVRRGTLFGKEYDAQAAQVCVIGKTVTENLFGTTADPVGKTIRINHIPVKVIGELAEKGQSAFGQDQDDVIIAPLLTLQKRMMEDEYVQQIFLSATSEGSVTTAASEIETCLRAALSAERKATDGFAIHTPSEITSAANKITQSLSFLLGAMAAISLIVGGIGIMNIMLVSVTERTREIGVRLAVGATPFDVWFQLLVESVVLSLVGGSVGIALGIAASRSITAIMGWTTIVETQSIALAFIVSSAVGVFFGWYPARKAAALNPIEALRYE